VRVKIYVFRVFDHLKFVAADPVIDMNIDGFPELEVYCKKIAEQKSVVEVNAFDSNMRSMLINLVKRKLNGTD
jgi:hypothetical protein